MDKASLKNEQLFSLLTDSSIDAMVAIDRSGNITAFNKAAEVYFDSTACNATGKPLTAIIPGIAADEEAKKAMELAFTGFKSFVPADKKVAYRRHSETHYIPLFNDEQVQIGVMQLTHDVAHRIKAEQELERLNDELNEKNDALQMTLSEMASFTQISTDHVKRPIRTLYTDLEFVIKAEAKLLSDSGKAAFRRMQSSLNKMNLLMDDMLQLSEIGMVMPKDNIHVSDIITTVTEKLQDRIMEKNARVTVEKLCTVKGDRELLEKLFYQLLTNAIRFNESPVPAVRISCVETEAVRPFDRRTGKYYRVCIEDNGIGIKEEDTERAFVLFEKVHDSNYRGSGLGLAMAKKIMHMHNGFITVEPAVPQGSCFNCYFPAI